MVATTPWVVRDVCGPGRREACARLRRYLRTDMGNILWKTKEGACGPAALVHGIEILRGKEVSIAYRNVFEELQPQINNLAALNK